MLRRSPFPPGSPGYSLAQEVEKQFRTWREGTPRSRRRLTGELWAAAVRLTRHASPHQVARFLSLEHSQLKQRAIAAYGLDGVARGSRHRDRLHPAQPEDRGKGQNRPERASLASRRDMGITESPGFRSAPQWVPEVAEPPPAGIPSASPASSPSTVGNDGFMQAPVSVEAPWLGPPMVAEVRSPSGWILRLFSPDTTSIIQTFLRS